MMKMASRLGISLSLAGGMLLTGCVAPNYPSNGAYYSGYGSYSTYGDSSYTTVGIGINVPVYPHLVLIPGYPVYYSPSLSYNYFFYDGVYWVFRGDNWYMSGWYNGPWSRVAPTAVPVFILRVPIRYYRNPPSYFHRWRADGPPRWGEHWGPEWERHRHGWDRWDRRATPSPAPLPTYQRQYSGNRYPSLQQQPALRRQHYGYQPHDPAGRQLYRERERHEQQQRQQRMAPQGQPSRQRALPEQRQQQPQQYVPQQRGVPQQRRPEQYRQSPPGRAATPEQRRSPSQDNRMQNRQPPSQRQPTYRAPENNYQPPSRRDQGNHSQPQQRSNQRDQQRVPRQEPRRAPQDKPSRDYRQGQDRGDQSDERRRGPWGQQ